MGRFAINVLLASVTVFSGLPGRAADDAASASCNFADGKQMSVRYIQAPAKRKDELSSGKIWIPGNQPLFLFTEAELLAGNADLPVGAYSMYIRGGKENWTLLVNKDVKSGSKYDQSQEATHIVLPLVHVNQQTKDLTIAFAQVGPKECNLRLYFADLGSWAQFREK